MILGRVIGKSTTSGFTFLVEAEAKKFDYCQVYHKEYDYVLAQIFELEKTLERVIAKCNIIGFKDDDGIIKPIRVPFDIGTEVLKASNEFIESVINLEDKSSGAYIGRLEGTDIAVHIDLNKLLTKHVSILAKSGSGKSYTVAVLLEELLEKKVPLLVIDPHGEYLSLKTANDNQNDLSAMPGFNIKPKGYKGVVEYGDINILENAKPLLLNENLQTEELINILPTKLSSTQMGLLYGVIKEIEQLSFDSLIYHLKRVENSQKWTIINLLEYMKKMNIFSPTPTPLNELIQSGICSVINLKGLEPYVQEVLVYKLLADLFAERKKDKVPPFFAIIEEAHNFVPERGFNEAKSSSIIKTIASEGRKFGLGLCVISQRPAIVQKTVLSQCTTQILLKITNPNDLKAVSNSVEGITMETEGEIKNLPVGTALVTGVVDIPLFVKIRPRKTKHGGIAVDMLQTDEKFMDKLDEFAEKELLPVIQSNISRQDYMIMNEKVSTVLMPCTMFLCKKKDVQFNLLMEMVDGRIIKSIDPELEMACLPRLDDLSRRELVALHHAYKLKKFMWDDIISKIGLDSEETLKLLLSKEYLIESEGVFSLGSKYILSDLSKCATLKKIEFVQVSFDKKLEKKQSIDKSKDILSRFVDVLDHRECFLVNYKEG